MWSAECCHRKGSRAKPRGLRGAVQDVIGCFLIGASGGDHQGIVIVQGLGPALDVGGEVVQSVFDACPGTEEGRAKLGYQSLPAIGFASEAGNLGKAVAVQPAGVSGEWTSP